MPPENFKPGQQSVPTLPHLPPKVRPWLLCHQRMLWSSVCHPEGLGEITLHCHNGDGTTPGGLTEAFP